MATNSCQVIPRGFLFLLLTIAVVASSSGSSVLPGLPVTLPPLLSTLLPDLPTILPGLPDSGTYLNSSLYNKTTSVLITEAGYPCETYTVTTTDGYILQLFRIPYSGKNASAGQNAPNKTVIFFMHGLLVSSSVFLINSDGKNLPYVLSDLNYDVWLGNARGTLYGRNHTSLSPSEAPFWNFTYHQTGIYDLPAMIDKALTTSGASKLQYIGHSMGTTEVLVLLSEKPEYNAKFSLVALWAPIAFTTNMKSPIRFLAPLIALNVTATEVAKELSTMGTGEYSPNNPMKQQMQQWTCGWNNYSASVYLLCSTPQFVEYGFDYFQVNTSLNYIQQGHYPQGSSIYAVFHLAQGINSGRFAKYDFGFDENMRQYNQSSPPDYNLKAITAPTILYSGHNDWLADPTDVENLSDCLLNTTLVDAVEIDYPYFNHGDFVTAINVTSLLNDQVVERLNEFRYK